MPPTERTQRTLLLGLALSTAVHVGFWATASGFVRNSHSRADSTSVSEARPPTPPKVRLGIDHSDAATMSWLGFEEATEHAAEFSAVDQSAMTPLPGSSGESPAAPAPVLTQPTPKTPPELTSTDAGRLNESLAQLNSPAAPKAATGGAPGNPGLAASKESGATSTKKAPAVRLGKVVAAEGLDIQTKSPRWSYTTMQLRMPRNPVVEITFGPDGKVLRAGFASEGGATMDTGFADVDQPLLSAIYSWTARGEKLRDLTRETGEVTVRITVLLAG